MSRAMLEWFALALAGLVFSGACAGEAFTGGGDGRSGTAGASGGHGGSGGSGPGFLNCRWDDEDCPTCEDECDPSLGQYCPNSCRTILDCVRENPGCETPDDLMCVYREYPSGDRNVCTAAWEGGGQDDMPATNAAVRIFNCLCLSD